MTDDRGRTGPTLRAMHISPRDVRCPLLIGRDELLELVDRRLDDVLAGRGQFLLLARQAGIGKRRFLEAINQKADAHGFVTGRRGTGPQDQDVPAALILDMARTMLRCRSSRPSAGPARARSRREVRAGRPAPVRDEVGRPHPDVDNVADGAGVRGPAVEG